LSDPTFCEVSIADKLRRLGCKASGLGDVASGPLLPAKSSQLRESTFPPAGLRPASEKDSNSTDDLREIASLTDSESMNDLSESMNDLRADSEFTDDLREIASLADSESTDSLRELASPADAEPTDDLREIASLADSESTDDLRELASPSDAEPTDDLGGLASPIDTDDPTDDRRELASLVDAESTDDLRALAPTAAVGSADNAPAVGIEGEGLLKSPRNGVEAVSCCR